MIERLTVPGDERLVRLLAYWDTKRRMRRMPARSDIDVTELRYVLGNVLLIEVTAEQRFRFRLHGTVLADRVGHDLTGRFVEDMPNLDNRAVMLARCRTLVSTKQPYMGAHRRVADRRRYGYEVLWVPLSADGDTVDMLLGCLIYTDDWWSAEVLDVRAAG